MIEWLIDWPNGVCTSFSLMESPSSRRVRKVKRTALAKFWSNWRDQPFLIMVYMSIFRNWGKDFLVFGRCAHSCLQDFLSLACPIIFLAVLGVEILPGAGQKFLDPYPNQLNTHRWGTNLFIYVCMYVHCIDMFSLATTNLTLQWCGV